MSKDSPTLANMKRAAEKAGRSLVRDFGEVENLQISQKGPGDFVSAADRRAESIIYEELKKVRPDYGFLMEESGVVEGKDTSHRWIIDPLDGTANFLHGLPHWCISIALEENAKIIAGVIYDPIKNEMFSAELGQGAYTGRKRLRVSGRSALNMCCIATGAPQRARERHELFFREYRAVWESGASLRRFGAAALDLAYVAAGRYDAFWERDLNSWDVAAGVLIVREAGGFISELDDDRKNAVNTGHILAANQGVYEPLKKILRAV